MGCVCVSRIRQKSDERHAKPMYRDKFMRCLMGARAHTCTHTHTQTPVTLSSSLTEARWDAGNETDGAQSG